MPKRTDYKLSLVGAVVCTNADTAPFRNGFVSNGITLRKEQAIEYQLFALFLLS
jgi:hypothetical protein